VKTKKPNNEKKTHCPGEGGAIGCCSMMRRMMERGYLKDRDISSDTAMVHSVLIVPCRFCPAASLAVREGKPYMELFRKFFRTPSYESYIQVLKSRLESEGIRTGVFDSKLPHQFVVCVWTSGRRKDLARYAVGYSNP
jgi:hypothetical protein